MAGLFELMKMDIPVDDPRLPSHALYSAMVLYANGDATGPQAIAYLEYVAGTTFNAATLSDLSSFASAIDLKTAIQVRDYLNVIHAYNIVVETSELLNETQWRTRLEIT